MRGRLWIPRSFDSGFAVARTPADACAARGAVVALQETRGEIYLTSNNDDNSNNNHNRVNINNRHDSNTSDVI